MNKEKVTINENEAIELMAYILTSSEGLMKEPPHYAILRMVSIADRMAGMWAPRASGDLAKYLDDLNKRMPVESAATQGDDIESFEKYLEEKISELAKIVKDRDFEEQDHGS